MVDTARIELWGTTIGAVTWVAERRLGVFQYNPDFLQSGIEVSPLAMPLREAPYEFPGLAWTTFKGLPGLLADALPDKFGNAIIDEWLASEGRFRDDFHPVERLCYIGTRGMGALEFQPSHRATRTASQDVDIERLVALSSRVLTERENLGGVFRGNDNDRKVIENILRVGTSAGGARAKAILAWNPGTGAFRSGQVEAGSGFEYWLMKFDGVSNNKDRELADPKGFGKIEYAYYLMARSAGIEMAPCRLHHEGGRSHFMTKRFDRTPTGAKIHMQSLGALAHYDYNQAGSYSYEQALQAMKRLSLPRTELEQQVLRTYFNIIARNQDDHVKNIAYLMNRRGDWSLSPAFDVSYAWTEDGAWTNQHQMSVNRKRDEFEPEDLIAFAGKAGIKPAKANDLISQVSQAVRNWQTFAREAGVDQVVATAVASKHRLYLDR